MSLKQPIIPTKYKEKNSFVIVQWRWKFREVVGPRNLALQVNFAI